MPSYIRGATVTIAVTFKDADGVITNPAGASVFLKYLSAATLMPVTAEVELSKVGDEWTAQWDSRVAAECTVRCHARTDEPLPLSATDFEFSLTANAANP